MIRILKAFQERSRARRAHAREAAALYEEIVREARQPRFYELMRVPDTPEGRFEMILLHMWLHLRGAHKKDPRARALVESFFTDMDRSLREAGIGDMGVPPRMKRMASAFYGRLAAYDRALKRGLPEMGDALRGNVYATCATSVAAESVAALASYVWARAQVSGGSPRAILCD